MSWLDETIDETPAPAGMAEWAARHATAAAAWRDCPRPDWQLWLAAIWLALLVPMRALRRRWLHRACAAMSFDEAYSRVWDPIHARAESMSDADRHANDRCVIMGSMSWLDADEKDIPTGLAEWAAAYPTSGAARAACSRADWLLWLLLAATNNDKLRRFTLHAAALAVEHSPMLRSGAASVAPVHIWGSPSPYDRPRRPFRARLLGAAALATVIAAVTDFAASSFALDHLAPSSRLWARAVTILVVWGVSFRLLDGYLERRADRDLDARVRAMTFTEARAIVVAALARSPEDPRALKALRDADAQWFRSTTP